MTATQNDKAARFRALHEAPGFFLIPTSKDPSAPRLDPIGAVLSIVGLVSLLYGIIEAPQRLEQHGRIAVKVPSFSNAASLIMRTDMVASIPRRLAKAMRDVDDLIVLEPPFDNAPVSVEAVWPRGAGADPAQDWLRKQVELAAADLD